MKLSKRVIISDAWYIIGDQEFFIHDWPKEDRKMFIDVFNEII